MAMHRFGRLGLYLVWAAGLALFVYLIAREGVAEIMAALTLAGVGLLWVAAFHLVPLVADTVAWRGLFGRAHRPAFGIAMWVRWIGESVNGL